MIPTGFSALIVGLGGLVGAGVAHVSQIVFNLTTLGSMILTGHMYFINELVTPSIYLNTQPAITFQADGDVQLGSGDLVFDNARNARPALLDGTEAFLASDRVTMAAGSAGVNQYVAAALNPFNGSGALTQAFVLCRGTPNSMLVTLSVSSSATATGAVMPMRHRTVSSGALLVYSGSVRVPQSQYAILVSASGSIANRQAPNCDLIPYWVEF